MLSLFLYGCSLQPSPVSDTPKDVRSVHTFSPIGQDPPENISFAEENDPGLEAATQRAQATLSIFWDHLENPRDGDHTFGLKFPLQDGGETEHMWLGQPIRTGDQVEGVLDNAPRFVKRWRFGDRLTLPIHMIEDWGYSSKRGREGSFSVRVLLDRLPPDERKVLTAQMPPFAPEP